MSTMPHGPWENLSIDFYSPTPSHTKLMVLTDEFSRFVIVKEVTSEAAIHIIPILHEVWATFGIPKVIKSDNGAPFNGFDFNNMCAYFNIKHRRITPYWPRANAEVERFNKNLGKVMKNSAVLGSSWKKELNFFLGSYRATPHATTGVPPSELMFKYNSTSRLVSIGDERKFVKTNSDSVAISNDQLSKIKIKDYADKRLHVKQSSFKVDDLVWYEPPKKKISYKHKVRRHIDLYKIIEIKGSMITARSNTTGHEVTRNSSCFRHYTPAMSTNYIDPNLGIKFDQAKDPTTVSIQSTFSAPVEVHVQPVHVQAEGVRISTRENKGKIDKLQVDPSKKSYE